MVRHNINENLPQTSVTVPVVWPLYFKKRSGCSTGVNYETLSAAEAKHLRQFRLSARFHQSQRFWLSWPQSGFSLSRGIAPRIRSNEWGSLDHGGGSIAHGMRGCCLLVLAGYCAWDLLACLSLQEIQQSAASPWSVVFQSSACRPDMSGSVVLKAFVVVAVRYEVCVGFSGIHGEFKIF